VKGTTRPDLGTASVQELARLFKLTPRRIAQYANEGMPRSAHGRYPLEACVQWYIARLEQQVVKRPAGPSWKDYDQARTRRANAQAQQAELQTSILEGSLMPVSLHAERLSRLVDSWAGVVKSIVGRWPSAFPEVAARDAQLRFRRLVNKLLAELEAGRVNGANGSRPESRRRRTARR